MNFSVIGGGGGGPAGATGVGGGITTGTGGGGGGGGAFGLYRNRLRSPFTGFGRSPLSA